MWQDSVISSHIMFGFPRIGVANGEAVTVFCFKMMIAVSNLKFDCHFKMWVFPKIGVNPPKWMVYNL